MCRSSVIIRLWMKNSSVTILMVTSERDLLSSMIVKLMHSAWSKIASYINLVHSYCYVTAWGNTATLSHRVLKVAEQYPPYFRSCEVGASSAVDSSTLSSAIAVCWVTYAVTLVTRNVTRTTPTPIVTARNVSGKRLNHLTGSSLSSLRHIVNVHRSGD